MDRGDNPLRGIATAASISVFVSLALYLVLAASAADRVVVPQAGAVALVAGLVGCATLGAGAPERWLSGTCAALAIAGALVMSRLEGTPTALDEYGNPFSTAMPDLGRGLLGLATFVAGVVCAIALLRLIGDALTERDERRASGD